MKFLDVCGWSHLDAYEMTPVLRLLFRENGRFFILFFIMYVITSVATLHRFKILIATKLKKIDDTRNSINPTQFVWFELVLLDDESPSAYLGNVHGFINK